MAASSYDYYEMFYDSSVPKDIEIIFTNGDVYTNEQIYAESLEINESICSESSLHFGLCEANSCKFTMVNPLKSHKNEIFSLYGTLDHNPDTRYHIGTYFVVEDTATADKSKREIVAYDEMYLIVNTDVTDWYNTKVTFPCNLYEFRKSFFDYLGINQETIVLPNDAMRVEKTISPQDLKGGEVLYRICELNGCFPNMNRQRLCEYVFLPKDSELEALYPADDLYPSDTLYPQGSSDIVDMPRSRYIKCEYSEYKTGRITQLQIREDKDDIGCIVDAANLPSLYNIPEVLSRDSSVNRYVVEDNFLTYGKNDSELRQIAENLLLILAHVTTYIPFSAECVGNPAVKLGKGIRISTSKYIVNTIILKRTLRGIQSLRDTYSAEGISNYEEDVDNANTSVIHLKGKTNRLLRTIEELRSQLDDLEQESQSIIEQTSEMIKTTVKKGELSSEISQEAGEIKIKSNRFSLESTNLRITSDGTIYAMAIGGNAIRQFSDMIDNSNAMYTARQAIGQAQNAASQAQNAASQAQSTANSLSNTVNNLNNTIIPQQNKWISQLSAQLRNLGQPGIS